MADPYPVVPLGTLDEYLAESGRGLNPGSVAYTTNPLAPLGSNVIYPQFVTGSQTAENGDSLLTWQTLQWNDDSCLEDPCSEQKICTALIHEAQTDWWYPFYSNRCSGVLLAQVLCASPDPQTGIVDTPLDITFCDPCYAPYMMPFVEAAQDAARQLAGALLANLFPFAALQMLGLTGTEVAQFDALTIACQQYDIIFLTFEIPQGTRRLYSLQSCSVGCVGPPQITTTIF